MGRGGNGNGNMNSRVEIISNASESDISDLADDDISVMLKAPPAHRQPAILKRGAGPRGGSARASASAASKRSPA
jgi:hypothetical protein